MKKYINLGIIVFIAFILSGCNAKTEKQKKAEQLSNSMKSEILPGDSTPMPTK